MGKKKAAIRAAEADSKRAAEADRKRAEEAEAAAALAKAMAAKAIVPSLIPIRISGLWEAQMLAVKLAPGAVVKVCSVAAKDASALLILLDRQRVRSCWKVAGEDLQALEALALGYLLVSTAIDAHHPVVCDNLGSTDDQGYLLAFRDWSLLLEDAAASVPCVGNFDFFTEVRNVARLARKVVVRRLNGKGDLEWFGTRLENIGEGLVTLIC